MNEFDKQVMEFNQLYKLLAPTRPLMPESLPKLVQRLKEFKSILSEELDEIDDVIRKVETLEYRSQVEMLTDIADLLGDLQVYCASEMRKYGLDNSVILSLIMASNMSKLGADGKAIYDERGKILKGPNYWRPEDQIKRYIQAAARQTPES